MQLAGTPEFPIQCYGTNGINISGRSCVRCVFDIPKPNCNLCRRKPMHRGAGLAARATRLQGFAKQVSTNPAQPLSDIRNRPPGLV